MIAKARPAPDIVATPASANKILSLTHGSHDFQIPLALPMENPFLVLAFLSSKTICSISGVKSVASVKMVSLPCGNLKILEMLAAVKWMIRPSMLTLDLLPQTDSFKNSCYLEAPMESTGIPIYLPLSDSSGFLLPPARSCTLSF